MIRYSQTALFILFFLSFFSEAKTVHYELNIENKTMNFTGKNIDFALTVNGTIPAPTLEFTEGDEAEIVVVNKLKTEEVSLHWHGILLPPEEDGVSYVNTPPIFPGKSRTFRFKIRQNGTFWYHSHTMLQEQMGVYGAIVIHPKKEKFKVDHDQVVMISDWSDENADQILKNLKKDGDYYLYKKNSVRSIIGALKAGQLKTYFQNEWDRMGGMDVSDIGYDAFLINGKKTSQLVMAHPGEKVRLRIINAGSSSYFHVSLGQIPFQVISADGKEVVPVLTKEILMGMAETYDVLFTVPEHKNYEFRATAQDITGFASTWIGMGPQVFARDKKIPNLYAPMNHSGPTGHSGHQGHGAQPTTQNEHSEPQPEAMDHSQMSHEMNPHAGHAMPMEHPIQMEHPVQMAPQNTQPVLENLGVDDLMSPSPTNFPAKAPVYELKLALDGDMERYVWFINGKPLFEDRLINIKEGEVIRFIFQNNTMMHHPMHLHGHFFRVLNTMGEFSPLKHTVDVPPMGTRTIEFYANEPGQWMLHCHNLYHMGSGMARVMRYNTFKQTPEQEHLDHQDHHLHDPWYQTGMIQAATNIVEGFYRISQTRNQFDLRAEGRHEGKNWNSEADLFYRRWMNNYLNFALGGASQDQDVRAEIGVGYLLPLLIETNFLIDQKGKLRVDLAKKFQWTSTLFSEAEYRWRQDPDLESDYAISIMYGNNWSWAMGLRFTGTEIGAGFQYKF